MSAGSPVSGPRDRFAELEAVKGETFSGQVTICDPDGTTPVDLTGYTIKLSMWNGANSDSSVAVDEQVCTTDPTNGEIYIDFTAVQTAAFNPIAYHFELWASNDSGQTKLLLWGWLRVYGSCPV